MTARDGFPSASGVADANEIRLGLAGLVVRDTAGNPRTGIFPRHTDALVTSTATMNSAAAAFESLLGRAGQGALFLPNDGVVNVLHDAAPLSNWRYDIIYVKQNDSVSPNADANNLPIIAILKGATGTASVPTYASAKAALLAAVGVGAGAEPISAVQIPSSATSMQSAGVVYTPLHQFTSSASGVCVVRNDTDRDAFSWPRGQQIHNLADGSNGTWDGTRWLIYDTKPQVHAATFLNFVPGNSVIQATYFRMGKRVRCEGSVNVGSTSTFASSPTLNFPFPGIAKYAAVGTDYILGQSGMLDRGTGFYTGPVFTLASSAYAIIGASAANGLYRAIDSTYPFTWVIGDEFSWSFDYEIA